MWDRIVGRLVGAVAAIVALAGLAGEAGRTDGTVPRLAADVHYIDPEPFAAMRARAAALAALPTGFAMAVIAGRSLRRDDAPHRRLGPDVAFAQPPEAAPAPASVRIARPGRAKARAADSETVCLAVALYYEARNQSELGQLAVAQVILNRVAALRHPPSVCGVIYENAHRHNRCQFSFACDGRPEQPRDLRAWQGVLALARAVMAPANKRGTSPLERLDPATRLATHYHATYVAPRWSRKLARTNRIGDHIFYVSARVWGLGGA